MAEPITTVTEIFSYFETFTNLEQGKIPYSGRNYHLDRMAVFLDYFAHPERAVPAIHIAGSKGKGSTAMLCACTLQAAGYKTGLYTSPHVTSYLERIQIDGKAADNDLLIKLANQIRQMVLTLVTQPTQTEGLSLRPTTFELLTLLAFLVFREAGCTMAVIETGLGGRLDATNLIIPLASLITPIDLEHTQILGDTLEKIAGEKSGIIKPHVPVFSGLQKGVVKNVIRQAAQQKGSPAYFLDEELESVQTDLQINGTDVKLKLKGQEAIEFRLQLIGNFQAENAALVNLALSRIFPELSLPKHFPKVFQEGFLRAALPGRLEIIKRPEKLFFILDGAHTPLAIERLLDSLEKLPLTGKTASRKLLIFGSVSDKNYQAMAEKLAAHFERIIISTPGTFKQSYPEQVYTCFKALNPETFLALAPEEAYKQALHWAARAGEKERADQVKASVVLVTGSFYMLAEIRKFLITAEKNHFFQ